MPSPDCPVTRPALQLHAAKGASREAAEVLTCILDEGHKPDRGERILHKDPGGYVWTAADVDAVEAQREPDAEPSPWAVELAAKMKDVGAAWEAKEADLRAAVERLTANNETLVKSLSDLNTVVLQLRADVTRLGGERDALRTIACDLAEEVDAGWEEWTETDDKLLGDTPVGQLRAFTEAEAEARAALEAK